MEINAEINRVFGQEMAKLFASQISEEELVSTAKRIWREMNTDSSPRWNKQGSDIDRAVKAALKERVLEEVKAITETDKFKEEAKERAEKIVQEIQEATHVKIVEEVSSRLAGMSVGGYGMGLRGMIEQVIMETLNR